MPPKTKKQKMLEDRVKKARSGRWKENYGENAYSFVEENDRLDGDDLEVSGLSELLAMSDEALDTDDECKDPSFDINDSLASDLDYSIEQFCEDWVLIEMI